MLRKQCLCLARQAPNLLRQSITARHRANYHEYVGSYTDPKPRKDDFIERSHKAMQTGRPLDKPRITGQLEGVPQHTVLVHAIPVNFKSEYFIAHFYVNELQAKVNCGKGGDRRTVRIQDHLALAFIISIANTTNYATHRKRIFRRFREAVLQMLKDDPSLLPSRPFTLQLTPMLKSLHMPWEEMQAQVKQAWIAATTALEALPKTQIIPPRVKKVSKAKQRRILLHQDDLRRLETRQPNNEEPQSGNKSLVTDRVGPSTQSERRSGREGDRFDGPRPTFSARRLHEDGQIPRNSEGGPRPAFSARRLFENGQIPKYSEVLDNPLVKYSPGERRKRPEVRGDSIRASQLQEPNERQQTYMRLPDPRVQRMLAYASGKLTIKKDS
ncbi:hypothetical protein BCR37DRAFT_79505 [Protomyces lactucae-debilis]|uniref:Uncharacterized protein n=1 Tax=Protomyces lactucae-debilis TaxID=2754530 RepID=A0A1Y2F8K3_PROLT|nr:uncharacterized protein BCR37DRAFT_79505 [Protomyces lactucae-debilis]ORY79957.1 hypothetical protein BCR37DRAFT_79505 [Protomyces lactucae-debilis]